LYRHYFAKRKAVWHSGMRCIIMHPMAACALRNRGCSTVVVPEDVAALPTLANDGVYRRKNASHPRNSLSNVAAAGFPDETSRDQCITESDRIMN
jgi:hypothetical protein